MTRTARTLTVVAVTFLFTASQVHAQEAPTVPAPPVVQAQVGQPPAPIDLTVRPPAPVAARKKSGPWWIVFPVAGGASMVAVISLLVVGLVEMFRALGAVAG